MQNINWKKLGNGISTVHGCFKTANKYEFCGNMIVLFPSNDCYCIGKGMENRCTPQSNLTGRIYRKDTGELKGFQCK